jgi:hypothetical protein
MNRPRLGRLAAVALGLTPSVILRQSLYSRRSYVTIHVTRGLTRGKDDAPNVGIGCRINVAADGFIR